jgi:hypothetical protein
MAKYVNNGNNILSNFRLSSSIPNNSTNNTGYTVVHTDGKQYDIAKIYDNYNVIPGDSYLLTNYNTNKINSTNYDINQVLYNNYNRVFGRRVHTNGEVKAMVVSGTDIYVGGSFTLVCDSRGILNANNIAKYNTITSIWSLVGNTGLGTSGNNGTKNIVYAIAVSGTDIYVG